MKNGICPYLGQRDDPTTALGFPSPGNFCQRAHPVAPVKLSHQSSYCLTGGHIGCPVYRSARPRPLPAAISAGRSQSLPVRQVLAIAVLPLVAAALIAVYLAFPGLVPQVERLRGLLIPISGQTQVIPTFGLFTTQNEVTYTPFSPQINTATPPPVRPDCPLPAGWTTYVVNPTDSFFRLSVVHNITVEDLQRNNCMGNETAIVPGQVIYVPVLPTLTPTSTALPTQYSLFPTNTPIPGHLPPPILPATPALEPTNTFPPPATSTPIPPTFTNTPSPTNTSLPPTATVQPTSTLPPTATFTPRPTRTRRPTDTATIPAPTNTPSPTNTPLPTNTLLPTDTPVPTETPLPTDTTLPSDTPVVVIFTDTPTLAPFATDLMPTELSPTPADTPTTNNPMSSPVMFAVLPILG